MTLIVSTSETAAVTLSPLNDRPTGRCGIEASGLVAAGACAPSVATQVACLPASTRNNLSTARSSLDPQTQARLQQTIDIHRRSANTTPVQVQKAQVLGGPIELQTDRSQPRTELRLDPSIRFPRYTLPPALTPVFVQVPDPLGPPTLQAPASTTNDRALGAAPFARFSFTQSIEGDDATIEITTLVNTPPTGQLRPQSNAADRMSVQTLRVTGTVPVLQSNDFLLSSGLRLSVSRNQSVQVLPWIQIDGGSGRASFSLGAGAGVEYAPTISGEPGGDERPVFAAAASLRVDRLSAAVNALKVPGDRTTVSGSLAVQINPNASAGVFGEYTQRENAPHPTGFIGARLQLGDAFVAPGAVLTQDGHVAPGIFFDVRF